MATQPVVSWAGHCVTSYVYQANGVHFRTDPGTGYASRGLLYKNDWGKKTATKGSWIKLQLGYQGPRLRSLMPSREVGVAPRPPEGWAGLGGR